MTALPITLVLNGDERTTAVEPHVLLVDLLRDAFQLTATHAGCESASCGACTVLVDGRPVKSCTMLGVQVDGCAVLTAEGLTQGDEQHPVAEGFEAEHSLRCGYCTPGMMMTAVALLAANTNPSDDQIRVAISGNKCRCTMYVNITKAVQRAAKSSQDVRV